MLDAPDRLDKQCSRGGNAGETVHSYRRVMDVEVLRWPDERGRIADLRRDGRLRLLLVEEGAAPPVAADPLEDWIRMPADLADLQARLEGLRRRRPLAEAHEPTLDDNGVFGFRGRQVVLPPVEARLACAMLANLGKVVSRDALMAAAWPDGPSVDNALHVRVHRLRARLATVGIGLRTVRGRGYLLHVVEPDGPAAGTGSVQGTDHLA